MDGRNKNEIFERGNFYLKNSILINLRKILQENFLADLLSLSLLLDQL